MRFSVFLAACVCAAFLFSLGGCADVSKPALSSVSQKPVTRQTPSYGETRVISQARPPVVAQAVPPIIPPASATQTPLKAAILLPLSGKNAALGQAMLNAAQQAVFDADSSNFTLQPRDTAGTGGAAAAAQAAVTGGAQMIIGPLFASDVALVAPVAQTHGLQILPLSTDTSLSGRGVYVMGLTPGAQVERVVSFAAAHGARHFAALVPVFRDAVLRQGCLLLDVETYNPAAHESEATIKLLSAQREIIDALFLPESGSDLKLVADQLASAGFDPARIHVLGTGLWDIPGLARESAFLNGGWYAAPDPAARRVFVGGYKAAYGQDPPRLATLAYDATALAAVLAKRGLSYDEASLTNPNGFSGLDGIFRLTPSGVVERGLAVNEVTLDGARVIDPTPTSFVSGKK